jgi:hypothetical protein
MGYVSFAVGNNKRWQTGNGAMAGNSSFSQGKKTVESKTSAFNTYQTNLKKIK